MSVSSRETHPGTGGVDPSKLLADVAQIEAAPGPGPARTAELASLLERLVQDRCVGHLRCDASELGSPAEPLPASFVSVSGNGALLPERSAIEDAAALLARSKRRVILVGRGAQGAGAEVEALATTLGAPVVATMPGRGVIADSHPLFAGGIGASGHHAALGAVRRADVILMLGVSSRGAVFGLEGRFELIQVDHDPIQLGRRPKPTRGLLGSVKETTRELREALPEEIAPNRSAAGRRDQLDRWLARSNRRRARWNGKIAPAAIPHALATVLGGMRKKATVVVDVGVTTLWVYRHLVGDHDVIWTSSFATMGFSMPGAIAVAEHSSDRPAVALTGDGGLGITMAELLTAVERNLPIVVVVFNNGKLAAIKYEQEVMGWPEFAAGLENCRFDAYARACGAGGIRVEDPSELEPALAEALASGRPYVVDVVCDPHAMPSPPRIHPLQAAGYLLAILRETAGFVAGLAGRRLTPPDGRPREPSPKPQRPTPEAGGWLDRVPGREGLRQRAPRTP